MKGKGGRKLRLGTATSEQREATAVRRDGAVRGLRLVSPAYDCERRLSGAQVKDDVVRADLVATYKYASCSPDATCDETRLRRATYIP